MEVLRLRFNAIGVEGATAMAECVKNNVALLMVDLENNQMQWEGVMKLGESLETNRIIERLDVTNNNIEDAMRKNLDDSRKLFSKRLFGVWTEYSEFFKPHIN